MSGLLFGMAYVARPGSCTCGPAYSPLFGGKRAGLRLFPLAEREETWAERDPRYLNFTKYSPCFSPSKGIFKKFFGFFRFMYLQNHIL